MPLFGREGRCSWFKSFLLFGHGGIILGSRGSGKREELTGRANRSADYKAICIFMGLLLARCLEWE